MKTKLILLPGVLAFISMFLYGAFDYHWWVTTTTPSAREFILILLHVLAMCCSCIGYLIEDIHE